MSSGGTLLLAVLATLVSGLVAGAFFAFSTFVMRAAALASATSYLGAALAGGS